MLWVLEKELNIGEDHDGIMILDDSFSIGDEKY